MRSSRGLTPASSLPQKLFATDMWSAQSAQNYPNIYRDSQDKEMDGASETVLGMVDGYAPVGGGRCWKIQITAEVVA